MVDNEPGVVLHEVATLEVELTGTVGTDIKAEEVTGMVGIHTVAIRVIVHLQLQTTVGTKEEH